MIGQLAKREASTPTTWFRRDPVVALREEMEGLMGRMFGGEPGWGSKGDWIAPPMDVSETDSEIRVRMDLPGTKAADVDIQVSGNVLTISGKREEEREETGRTFHSMERRTGQFSRQMSLACPVQEDKVDAHYRDGVLTVTLPKTAEARARKIKVKE